MLWGASVIGLAIGVFYAFNAYIQVRERGFAEPLDVPIAIAGIFIAIIAGWRALALRRAR